MPHHLVGFEVDEQECLLVAYSHQWLVRVGEGDIHQVSYIAVGFFVAVRPFVDVVEGKELLLPTGLDIDEVTFFHIGLYQLVAPPCKPHVLGLHVAVVGATEVEVFQRKEFVLSFHVTR